MSEHTPGYQPNEANTFKFDESTFADNEMDHLKRLGMEMPNYRPFDPVRELEDLREPRNPEEFKQTGGQRRSREREQLTEYKKTLSQQKETIAEIIRSLETQIRTEPDSGAEKLKTIVMAAAPQGRLTGQQLIEFGTIIDYYQNIHKAVERYTEQYPDPNELFQACFKQKPTGQVEVMKGPMTIHFQCFEQDDFTFASRFSRTKGDPSKITEKDKKLAKISGGVALGRVAIPELAGAVTIENTSQNKYREMVETDNAIKQLLHNSSMTVAMLGKSIDIDSKDMGHWRVNFVTDTPDNRIHMQIINARMENSRQPIFDMPIGDYKNLEVVLAHDKRKKTPAVGLQFSRFGNDYFVLQDFTKNGTIVTTMALAPGQEKIEDTLWSATILRHEEQHQINRLFRAARRFITPKLNLEGIDDGKQALEKFTVELVQKERQEIGIDERVRDELLAYYKDGSVPEDIIHTLINNKLYDYRDQYKEWIAQIKYDILPDLLSAASDVYEKKQFTGSIDEFLNIWEPGGQNIRRAIEEVFTARFNADIATWATAMGDIEKKGYSREEVLSMLYPEPVNDWPNLARRLLPKNKSEATRAANG